MITTDYKKTAPELLPDGEYECRIYRAGYAETRGGTEYISILLDVVDGEYAGRRLERPMWRRKTPGPGDIDGFSVRDVMIISQAAGLPEGANYDGLPDWMDALPGRYVIATIGQEEYNGYINNRIRYLNPSTRKPMERQAVPAGFTPVDDDDLPF